MAIVYSKYYTNVTESVLFYTWTTQLTSAMFIRVVRMYRAKITFFQYIISNTGEKLSVYELNSRQKYQSPRTIFWGAPRGHLKSHPYMAFPIANYHDRYCSVISFSFNKQTRKHCTVNQKHCNNHCNEQTLEIKW